MQVVMQSWESKLELFVSKGILPDSKEIRGTGVMRIFLLLLLFCVPVGALTTDVEVVHPRLPDYLLVTFKKSERPFFGSLQDYRTTYYLISDNLTRYYKNICQARV